MTTVKHDFGNPLPKYRAESAVNNRLRKPTFDEEMTDNAVKGLVKSLEAIEPKISIKASTIYLVKQGYNVIRIT